MKTNEKLIEVWKAARVEGEAVPRRSALNPALIVDYLPYIAVVERKGPETMFIRLAGTGIESIFNLNMQGLNGLEHVVPTSRDAINKLYVVLNENKCGAVGRRIFVTKDGFNIDCEVTILPFKGNTPETPQYIVWYNTSKIDNHTLQSERFIAYDYYKLDFLDLGNGVPDIDLTQFIKSDRID